MVKSASQLNTYKLCPRKWYIQYREGLRTPTHPSAQLGKDVHQVAEDWLRTGLTPDADTETGRIFIPGIPYLPTPGPSLKIEHKFNNGEFRGFIDLFIPDDPPTVIDHKTCKTFSWMLTPTTLADDYQGIIYANQALKETGASKVHLRWVYYKTKGTPQSRKTEVTLTKTIIDKKYAKLVELSHNIDKTPSDILKVPGNAKACSAFGGCHFRSVCHNERQPMSELLEKLKQMQMEKTPGVNPPKENPSGVPKPRSDVKKRTPTPTPAGDYTLYINCMPDSGGQDPTTHLVQLAGGVAEKADKQHYRLIDYGQGVALYEKSVEEWVEAGQNLEGAVIIDTTNRLHADALSALVSSAKAVVRGIR